MASIIGKALRGFGRALKKSKKAERTVFKAKPELYIKQFKKSKKHGLAKKLDVWANRESGKIFSQVGSGVNIKFKKSGMPYVPKGIHPSKLTKAKGWAKISAVPLTAIGVEKYHKGKKNGNKK